MGHRTFQRAVELPLAPPQAFAWHERPGALHRLLPPWDDVRIERAPTSLAVGTRVELSMPVGPLRQTWVAEHTEYEPAHQFVDVQKSGPFAHWRHTHRFEPSGKNACRLLDEVAYQLPGGVFGGFFGGGFVADALEQMFAYRHRTIRRDLDLHKKYASGKPLRVVISGGSGLIGSHLIPFLTTGGHEVYQLVRPPAEPGDRQFLWNPNAGECDPARWGEVDAVIHLGGKGIADDRWTDTVKQQIRDSRVGSTRLIAETVASMQPKPRVLICASATGVYGDRGQEELTETSDFGEGFLADVGKAWEAAADPAREAGIRVVHARLGVVLTPKGGALRQMLTPFRLGAGGPIGSGRQVWSWIGIDDAVAALYHCIASDEIDGPVNIVSPQPVSNLEFSRILGEVLHRPSVFAVPGFTAQAMFGEMANEALLASARVVPQRLENTGFTPGYPTLTFCLQHLLGRIPDPSETHSSSS